MSIDTCQNKVSTDQYHMTILWAQVKSLMRSHFFNLTTDQALVLIGSQAHVRLTCKQGLIVQKPAKC